MNDRVFVDANVLVYAHDLDAARKYQVASQLVEELWANHLGIVSIQVLQEFYVTITTKIAKRVSKTTAAHYVADYFVWPVVRPSVATLRKAFEIETQNRLSFWDAMIVSSAFQSGAKKILSEDLNPGQRIAGIAIVNPFQ